MLFQITSCWYSWQFTLELKKRKSKSQKGKFGRWLHAEAPCLHFLLEQWYVHCMYWYTLFQWKKNKRTSLILTNYLPIHIYNLRTWNSFIWTAEWNEFSMYDLCSYDHFYYVCITHGEMYKYIQSVSLRPGMHSFFFWVQRILNEGSNWMQKKKLNVSPNYKLLEKTASHDMQIHVLWLADWLFMVHFAVNFQTKAKKAIVFSYHFPLTVPRLLS